MPLIGLLTVAAIWLALAMAGAWALQRATRNCGWVDAVWSLATGLGAAFAAIGGTPGRAPLAAAMAVFWGVRLAWHIARRTRGAPEDRRYAAFRHDWGAAFERRLFLFLMVQAAAAWVLVASVAIAARNPTPFPAPGDAAGAALLLISVAGEGLADAQMQRFRSRRTGGVCQEGLWAWSRHPNYFFEFLAWCAYPLLGMSAAYPQGALAIAAPVLMFFLLRYVSGVPPLEKSMLERRGDAFRAYQARVSAFFPLPPKRTTP